ncbi:GrpB family protein [Nocardiopsis sp. MG754419]|uniref:GrpB family protein n=1 Tax=Nocardiopsis sp. MG754419 TaxID=2259865 RepID=UPI001BAC78E7|nr:GrpB family protein [Nocardiopsis sp. MG754419]MBR8742555.1 hypothetical protein [Nocardiopsis sp. MG754419]
MSTLKSPSLPSRGAARTDSHQHNLVNGRVTIAAHDPKWPYLFRQEADRIRQTLGDRALSVEHVGSTAVPGMDAKPCIDIQVAVADPTDESAYLPSLAQLGYSVFIPVTDWDEHLLLKGSRVNVNLHVFAHGSEGLVRARLLRDYLTADAGARLRYAAVKHDLSAREWSRIHDYLDAKSGIVTELLAEAHTWRAATQAVN